MRIRSIKPEFFLHDRLFEAERAEGLPLRLAFIGLWCAADREGRFAWEPRRLGAVILPYDGVDFSRVLDALVTRGFLVRYTSDSRELCFIPSFLRHQVINNRESPSVLPPPSEPDAMGLATRATRVADACPTPLVHAQGEGKGRERERKGTRTTGASVRRAPFSEDEFDHLLSPAMRAHALFLESWRRWCTFRKAKGKRISELGAKGQIKELHAAGIPASIAAISKSIASDWTGLFPESVSGALPPAKSGSVLTFADIAKDFPKPITGPLPGLYDPDGDE